MKKFLRPVGRAALVAGLTIALVLGAASALLAILGESPSLFFEALGNALGTGFGLGYTLFYATPLILTGCAVAVPFRCGLFNIGGEGQLYLGAGAAVAASYLFPNLPMIVAVPLAALCAGTAGGAWGGLAGFLKVKRGSHEVITTILLNFIAIAFVNYLILYPMRNPHSQAPESIEIGAGYRLATLHDLLQYVGIGGLDSTPANVTILLAIGIAIFLHFFLFRTVAGYELRCVGASEGASRYGGVPVASRVVMAMAIGGATAGLVGVNEVLGYRHTLLEGFSPGYGFTGIAVALLAANRPLRVIPVALFFGALYNGCRELEFLSDKITKELSLCLQAMLIALVASLPVLKVTFARWRDKLLKSSFGARLPGRALTQSNFVEKR